MQFRSAEHYMMWRKARLFADDETAGRIVAANHPSDAKMLGRGVGDFDEQTWIEHRSAIVVDASTAKFGQNPPLRDFLLGTGDASSWRQARPTASGASACRRPTRAPRTRRSGEA